MKKIEHYILPEHANALYKNEAISSMALAKETADKINELIDAYNELAKSDIEHEQDQDGRIAKAILYMKDNLINSINDMMNMLLENGIIEDYCATYLIDLNARVENLLGQIKPGNTTTSMDAEIIDARLGIDGKEYNSVGLNIRENFKKTQMWKTPKEFDCNACDEVGHYFIGSSDSWKNTPDGYMAGILIVYRGETKTRLYQQFQTYNDNKLYLRCCKGETWTSWTSTPNINDTMSMKTGTAGLGPCNLDTILDAGMYRLTSSNSYENAPEVAGLLIVYNTGSPNQYYQQFNGFTGKVYTRAYVNGVMGDWKKLVTTDSLPTVVPGGTGATAGVQQKKYLIRVLSNTELAIYKHGANGKIKFILAREQNTDINQDVFRITKIEVCDANYNTLGTISNGADIDGVIKMYDDHFGGLHGYELVDTAWGVMLFVDGWGYDVAYGFTSTLDGLEANEIKFNCNSDIETWSGLDKSATSPSLNRDKFIEFTNQGVLHIMNHFKSYFSNNFDTIRGAMFSISDEYVQYYHSSKLLTGLNYLADEPEHEITSNNEMDDIYYCGNGVSVRHWCGDRPGNDAGKTCLVHDYGDRIKSYFNCYSDGKQLAEDETITTHNYIEINV